MRNEHRSKNELLEFARPCCCAVLKAAFWEALSFLSVPAAAFDIEDHPSRGRKTVSLSSPDHAVSLFRRQPFWEGFWVRSRGFAGRDIQTQPKVPTVYFEGNWRCKLHPKAAKPPFFIDSGCDVLGSLDGQKSRCVSKLSPGAK